MRGFLIIGGQENKTKIRRFYKMEKEFFTVRTLAKYLDMSEQTCYVLSRQGVIPGRVKVGKLVRFNKAVVVEWLKNGGAKDDSQN